MRTRRNEIYTFCTCKDRAPYVLRFRYIIYYRRILHTRVIHSDIYHCNVSISHEAASLLLHITIFRENRELGGIVCTEIISDNRKCAVSRLAGKSDNRQRMVPRYILIYRYIETEGGSGERDSGRHLAWIDRDIKKINRGSSVYTTRAPYVFIYSSGCSRRGWRRRLSHRRTRERAHTNLFASPANVNTQALPLSGRNIISFTSMTHAVEISVSI